MSLIKVKDKYQVTIPAEIRSELSLRVGDLLEAKLEGDHIIMRPKMVVDKSQAWKRLFEVLDRVNSKNSEFSPEEVEQDVLAAIRESRGK